MSVLSFIVPAPTVNHYRNAYLVADHMQDTLYNGLGEIQYAEQEGSDQIGIYGSINSSGEVNNKLWWRAAGLATWLDIRNWYDGGMFAYEIQNDQVWCFSFWIKVLQTSDEAAMEAAGFNSPTNGTFSNMAYDVSHDTTIAPTIIDYKLPVFDTNRWQHCYVIFQSSEYKADWTPALKITGTVSGSISYVLDGMMLEKMYSSPSYPLLTENEETAYGVTGIFAPSTFVGEFEEGCLVTNYLLGPETDERYVYYGKADRNGGQIIDIEDLNYHLVNFQGLGSPKIKVNMTDNAFNRTKTYQSTQIESRILTLNAQIVSQNLVNLHKIREGLLQLLLNKSISGEELLMLYKGAQFPKIIKGYYEAGLELDKKAEGFTEDISLRFTTTTPYAEALGRKLYALGGKQTIVEQTLAYTDENGEYREIEFTANGDVNCIAKYFNYLVVGGSFTTFNGQSRNRLLFIDTTMKEDLGVTTYELSGFTSTHNVLCMAVDESMKRIYVGLDIGVENLNDSSFRWYNVDTNTLVDPYEIAINALDLQGGAPCSNDGDIFTGYYMANVTKIKIHKYTYQNKLQTVIGLFGEDIRGFKLDYAPDTWYQTVDSHKILFWLPQENDITLLTEIQGAETTASHNRYLHGPHNDWIASTYNMSILDFLFVKEPIEGRILNTYYDEIINLTNGFSYIAVGRFIATQPADYFGTRVEEVRRNVVHFSNLTSTTSGEPEFYSIFYPSFSEGGLIEPRTTNVINYVSAGAYFQVEGNVKNVFYGSDNKIYITGRATNPNYIDDSGYWALNILVLENGDFVMCEETWYRRIWQGGYLSGGPDTLSYPTKFTKQGKMICFLPANYYKASGYLNPDYGDTPPNQEEFEVAFGQIYSNTRAIDSLVYLYNGYYEWENAYVPSLRHPEEVEINGRYFALYKEDRDAPTQNSINYYGNAPSLCEIIVKNNDTTKLLAAYNVNNLTSKDNVIINKYLQPNETIVVKTDDTQGILTSNLREDLSLNIASSGSFSLVRNPSNINRPTPNLINSCFYVYDELATAYSVILVVTDRYLGID